MLSHLRFHRRAPSNPTSPATDQAAELPSRPNPQQSLSPLPHTYDHLSGTDQQPLSSMSVPGAPANAATSSSSSLPPVLPPIARVSSAHGLDVSFDVSEPSASTSLRRQSSRAEHRSQPPRSPYLNDNSGFIGGVALENYRRGVQSQSPRIDADARNPISPKQDDKFDRPRAAPRPPGAALSSNASAPVPSSSASLRPGTQQQPKLSPSFVSPTDFQTMSSGFANSRSSGGGYRDGSESAASLATSSVAPPAPLDAPRGKKGLPFLKNPMSTLLMRRKGNQPIPDLHLPLQAPPEDPPFIRGTKIHDFSAPRPRKNTPSTTDVPPANPQSSDVPVKPTDLSVNASMSQAQDAAAQSRPQRSTSDTTLNTGVDRTPSWHVAAQQPVQTTPAQPDSLAPASTAFPPRKSSKLGRKPLPLQESPPPPTVPPKDEHPGSVSSVGSSTLASHHSISATSSARAPTATPSARTTRSQNMSLSERPSRDMLASIPKHMKSTSSRFSFDMIGAAKQERLLEERHRQRQLERNSLSQADAASFSERDSRYDDLDDFDYDDMMDDDGLEERIPGVNADLDEEEYDYSAALDPDNDQENFSGFVFQRSNPTSGLTSPQSAGMLETPRDADGKVIGFAVSRDTPEIQTQLPSPNIAVQTHKSPELLAGLGIHSLPSHTADEQQSEQTSPPANLGIVTSDAQPAAIPDDDLYFHDNMLGLEGEDELTFPAGNQSTFDESIFDADDTDQYGRPIPGAFALAQALRTQKPQQQTPPQQPQEDEDERQRESDVTSRLSAQSHLSQSTTHTSLSVAGTGLPFVPCHEPAHAPRLGTDIAINEFSALPPDENGPESRSMAVYQAALAAAAHKAAASGKFRRVSSSPPTEAGEDEEEVGNGTDDYENTTFNPDDYEYDDDMGGFGVDDYEQDTDGIDYDAIIAEANASALANDSDGWYGQEFGFYAAPVNQHSSHHSTPSANTATYEFSNGGYFGPSGVSRTMSGRVVSREPNLTPITERSEYSNRNSTMSLAVPPIGSGASSLHSPGLAQLAMMADGSDDISLSALMRLRSKTFGSSQASLLSSRDGSPRSDRGEGASSPSGNPSSGFLGVGHTHARKNSAFSILSRESEIESPSGSPTLTMSMPVITSSPPPVPPTREISNQMNNAGMMMPTPLRTRMGPALVSSPISLPGVISEEDFASSPASSPTRWEGGPKSPKSPKSPERPLSGSRRWGPGHRHKGSAESVSYVMEEESGETRWVVERRRTGESGEVELLEREFVEGGRI